jgi:hypothetical protein
MPMEARDTTLLTSLRPYLLSHYLGRRFRFIGYGEHDG